MAEKAKIFEAKIHDEGYRDQYLTRPATAASLIDVAGRETELLSGVWHYTTDWYDTCLRAQWFDWKERDDGGRLYPPDHDFDAWPTMTLPAVWNLRDERLFYYESSVVFTRTFQYKNHGEKRVFIRFGAAHYRAYVFLNRRLVGSHDGGSTPFSFEVTDLIAGDENRIVVVVENARRNDRLPMSNTDWFHYGGLFRDIELVRVPESFIADVTATLVPDDSYGKLRLGVEVNGTASEASVEIPELGVDEKIPLMQGRGEITVSARPELWSVDSPRLYSVRFSCGEDRFEERIGFRQVKVKGNRVELNGKPLFLRGVSVHEESVANGRAVTEEEIRDNFRIAKEMNCNYLRLAHYPHSEKVSQIADEEGIMLWEEIPVYWAIDFENPATFADAKNQLAELVRRDKNRASVIIWSVGNENADSDARLAFMKGLAETAREIDGTRPVSAACLVDHVNNRIADRLAEHLDIIGLNEYYGWYDPHFEKLVDLFENSRPEKPVIISEFGGGAVAGHHGSRDEQFTEENQEYIYQRQVATFKKISYVAGTSPWIFFDFRCPRRTNPFQDGYNRKGLLNADKSRKKLAFAVMRDYYAEIAEWEG